MEVTTVAQHGSTGSQRPSLLERLALGWHDVTYAQHLLAVKNRPWIVGASIHHVRRIDS